MATTDPETGPPERTVNIRQERIEGGVGVSIGHADKVIQDSSRLWTFGMLGIVLFLLVVLVSFSTNIAGVQDGLCRAPGLHGVCTALGLGHLPSPEEEAVWVDARSGDSCEALRAYLTRWPTGAFVAEAQARLDGRGVTTETTWTPQEMRLPLTVRGDSLFEDELSAREDALQRATAAAEQTCEPLRGSPLHRLLGSSSSVKVWNCTPIGPRWRCGFDGLALCRLELGRSQERERCAPPVESQ